MSNKFANLPFASIQQWELSCLSKNEASGTTINVFIFLKMNIDVKTGALKSRIGEDRLNYTTIGKKLGYHRTSVKRAVKWLNKHLLINTFIVKELNGYSLDVKKSKG